MQMKKNICILLVIEFISSLFFIKVINTLYFQSKGISLSKIGIILAIYQISKLIFEIPTGVIADKYSRKLSLFIGFILFDVYISLNFFSKGLFTFVIAVIIQGIAFTFLSGSSAALFVDSIIKNGEEKKIAYYSSILRMVGYSGLAIGALLGGIFADRFDYNFVYKIQILTFSIPIVLILFVKEPNISKSEKNSSSFCKSCF